MTPNYSSGWLSGRGGSTLVMRMASRYFSRHNARRIEFIEWEAAQRIEELEARLAQQTRRKNKEYRADQAARGLEVFRRKRVSKEDDDLIRRIAQNSGRLNGEEGIDKDWFISGASLHTNHNPPIGTIRQSHWSPLRVGDDTFGLVLEYNVSLKRVHTPSGEPADWFAWVRSPDLYVWEVSDPDAHRAVCLAIDAMLDHIAQTKGEQ